MISRILLYCLAVAFWCLPAAGVVAQDLPGYWYDGATRRPLFLSETQMAVFPISAKSFAKALQDREIFKDSNITKSGEYVTYLRLAPEEVTNRITDKDRFHESIKNISPVFFSTRAEPAMSSLVPTGNVVVQYASQTSEEIASIEQEFMLPPARILPFTTSTRLYALSDPIEAIRIANAIYETCEVAFAVPDWLRERQTKDMPDDPLFAEQWLLNNTGQDGIPPGIDIAGAHLTDLWTRYKGSAEEVIAIVDDGVEMLHPDLSPNLIPDVSWDFIDEDQDPSPDFNEPHGTACAGVAAARGFNGQGIAGVAPLSGLAGIRLIGAETDVNSALALTRNNGVIDIFSNSWGPADDGDRLDGPGPLFRAALAEGVTNGRGGLGSIYVWAAGNGLQSDDNANYDGYANSRFVLAVTATDHLGKQASYAEPGANIALNAPSSGNGQYVTTTDVTGLGGYNRLGTNVPLGTKDYEDTDYTAGFGGTSAACPTVAGVAALMLQANPDLTWREVRNILMLTAEVNDPEDEDWTLNGAGLPVNHKYGFGRVNALEAVEAARSWISVGQEREAQAQADPFLPIPDDFYVPYEPQGSPDENATAGEENATLRSDDPATVASSSLTIDQDFTVEFVEVVFTAADHDYWGDLQVELVSPQGTVSVLSEAHYVTPGSYSYDGWRFGTVRHLGESSNGTWTLRVSDRLPADTGTFQSWSLHVHGWGGYSGPAHTSFFPHVLTTDGWTTEIGLVNTSASQDATGELRGYRTSGEPAGPPVVVSIPPRGRVQVDVASAYAEQPDVGYVVLDSPAPWLRGYQKIEITDLYRAALPALTSVPQGDLLLSHVASSEQWWTGLVLLNTTLESKDLSLEFDNGSVRELHLAPMEQKTFLIRSLFDDMAQPDIHTGIIRNAAGVAGSRFYLGGTMLAGLQLSDGPYEPVLYNHVVDNPEWWTGSAILNPSNATVELALSPRLPDGLPLEPLFKVFEPGANLIGLPSELGLPVETAWFQAQATGPVTGLQLFGTDRALAGMNACTTPRTSGVLPKLESDGPTWLSFINTTNATSELVCQALNATGGTVTNATRTLPPYGSLFVAAHDLFAGQDMDNATHVHYDSQTPLCAIQINGSTSGMVLDALPGL